MAIDFRLWPKRKIKENALIHETVFKKIKDTTYNPTNINPDNTGYQIEKSQPIHYP